MVWLWALWLALAESRTQPPASPAPPASVSAKPAAAENIEKVEFRKARLTLGSKVLAVELAESERQHARGLMYRQKLGEGEGMLFIFPDLGIRSFWMKNTFVDLAIGFFD